MSQNLQRTQDFFKHIPSELIVDIISRLPVLSVMSCKCVCKTWLNLLETEEFIKFHLSKAVTGLAVNDPDSCIIYDLNDAPDLEHHELHYNPITDFKFIHFGVIQGSVNGIILMCYQGIDPNEVDLLYVLNPITYEYIQITSCNDFVFKEDRVVTYGFGQSLASSQLKAVRIFQDCLRDDETEALLDVDEVDCRVYTLGTGSWRSISHDPVLEYDPTSIGALLHGNLHWLVYDSDNNPMISCLDLEEEVFSFFPSPELVPNENDNFLVHLHALEDCLCLSDNTSDQEVVIWLLKDYMNEMVWTKDLVISRIEVPYFRRHNQIARPVKMFKDGDILMIWGRRCFFVYSSKNRTARDLHVFETYSSIDTILHTSSFFSLKGFGDEVVNSFR